MERTWRAHRKEILKTSTKSLIAVVGPTAVGKTAMAIQLAEHLQTVILSADSRQFYREMTIGTAKPGPDELARVPHYFIDSHPVDHHLSAGDYEREALTLLDELFEKHSQIVLVGGSGLYVDALRRGLDDLPSPKPGVREKWNAFYAAQGIEALQQALERVDPAYYEVVDLYNPQRLIRALEVYESTGKPFSSFWTSTQNQRPFQTIMVGLNMEREALYQRINERVDQMMADGLLEEVRSLRKYRHLPALKTVGYAELFDHLDGRMTWAEATEKIKQNTRRFAKRQLTWFRKDPETVWFTPADFQKITAHLDAVISP